MTPTEKGLRLGRQLGIRWDRVDFTPAALYKGAVHEKEHGGSLVESARVAVDHLKERYDYYERLARAMRNQARRR